MSHSGNKIIIIFISMFILVNLYSILYIHFVTFTLCTTAHTLVLANSSSSLSLPRSRSVYIEEGHKFIFIRMKFAEILYFRYSDIETQSIWNELLLSCGAILFLFFYIKNKYSLFFLFFSIISSISYFVADNCVKVYGHWQHK